MVPANVCFPVFVAFSALDSICPLCAVAGFYDICVKGLFAALSAQHALACNRDLTGIVSFAAVDKFSTIE